MSFSIVGQPLTDAFNPGLAKRRRLKRKKEVAERRRLEKTKELGDTALTVAELDDALAFVKSKLGIKLHTLLGAGLLRPKFSIRELLSACTAVQEGTTYRDRVQAVRRLQKMGFRVSFTVDGHGPSELRR